MTIGPLRRTIGVVGLIALAPIAWLLITGAISPVDAATRAGSTVVAIICLGRIAGFGVDRMAASLERSAVAGVPATHGSPDAPTTGAETRGPAADPDVPAGSTAGTAATG